MSIHARAYLLTLLAVQFAALAFRHDISTIQKELGREGDEENAKDHAHSAHVQSTNNTAEVDTKETSTNAANSTLPIDMETLSAIGGALQTGLKIGGQLYSKMDAETVHEFTTEEPVEVEVLPEGADSFRDMGGWQRKQVDQCQPLNIHRSKDAYILAGIVYAQMDCKPTFAYGGNYKGKGMYVKNAKLNCKLQANYGTSVKLTVRADTPVNTGSVSEPVPQISVIMGMEFKTPTFKSGFKEAQFTFGGDGQFHFSSI